MAEIGISATGVDEGIKKVVILAKDLPPLSSNNTITFRYRVVSEDRNRVSDWSQNNVLSIPNPLAQDGVIEVFAKTIKVTWNLDPNKIRATIGYDVFVKYDSGSWTKIGSPFGSSFSFLKPTGYTTVYVSVQNQGDTQRNPLKTIYEDSESLV